MKKKITNSGGGSHCSGPGDSWRDFSRPTLLFSASPDNVFGYYARFINLSKLVRVILGLVLECGSFRVSIRIRQNAPETQPARSFPAKNLREAAFETNAGCRTRGMHLFSNGDDDHHQRRHDTTSKRWSFPTSRFPWQNTLIDKKRIEEPVEVKREMMKKKQRKTRRRRTRNGITHKKPSDYQMIARTERERAGDIEVENRMELNGKLRRKYK